METGAEIGAMGPPGAEGTRQDPPLEPSVAAQPTAGSQTSPELGSRKHVYFKPPIYDHLSLQPREMYAPGESSRRHTGVPSRKVFFLTWILTHNLPLSRPRDRGLPPSRLRRYIGKQPCPRQPCVYKAAGQKDRPHRGHTRVSSVPK